MSIWTLNVIIFLKCQIYEMSGEFTLACRGGSKELLTIDVFGTGDGGGCS